MQIIALVLKDIASRTSAARVAITRSATTAAAALRHDGNGFLYLPPDDDSIASCCILHSLVFDMVGSLDIFVKYISISK